MPKRRRLTGKESLLPRRTVADFWRWAMNDLQMNTTRGFLAEYIVAQAVKSKSDHRVEWDVFDVLAGDGTRIEVKSSGFLQSWAIAGRSTPRWGFSAIDTTRIWDEELREYVDVDPADRVDVWVFALQTATSMKEFDPTEIGQWEFRVVANCELLGLTQRSIGLRGLDTLGVKSVSYDDLANEVNSVARRNSRLRKELRQPKRG